jgi:hypothetical protein
MSRQAVVVDIHRYYRTGGIDWPRCASNFDAVGIRAARGMEMDELFYEHVDGALSVDLPYFTYTVPDPLYPADELADFYIGLDGVANHAVAGDVEPTLGRFGDQNFYRSFFMHLASKSGEFDPMYYSNYNSTKKLGFPQWVLPMRKWWAEYPYEFPIIRRQYRRLDSYLDKNPYKIPKWASRVGYTPFIHQFTDYGDAQYYLANATTGDPKFSQGIKSCDLNVSLVPVEEFMAYITGGDYQPTLAERVQLLEEQVLVLSAFHEL